jgi:hypothetical protein
MIPGTNCKIGEQEYTIPPLTIGQLRGLAPKIKKLGGLSPTDLIGGESLDIVIEIILAAINRNYPTMTGTVLEDLLDVGNIRQVFFAVMAISGMEERAPGPPGP